MSNDAYENIAPAPGNHFPDPVAVADAMAGSVAPQAAPLPTTEAAPSAAPQPDAAPQDSTPSPSNTPAGMVAMRNPDGDLVHVPETHLDLALEQGYEKADPKDVQDAQLQSKYGSLGQQIATGVEHGLSAATFGLSTGAERLLGVPGEDIRGRSAANPVAAGVGSVVGLAGTMALPGFGEAAVANDALQGAKAAEEAAVAAKKAFDVGDASAEAVLASQQAAEAAAFKLTAQKTAAEALNPISATSLMAKAGQKAQQFLEVGVGDGTLNAVKAAATRGAVENALFSGGDILSRTFAGDPPETFGSALEEVGLSSVIGGGLSGAFGTVPPLWKAANESKLAETLSNIKNDWLGGDSTMANLSKKVLSHFGNVSVDDMDHYIKFRDRVNASPELTEVRDRIADHLYNLKNAVEDKTITTEEATKSFKTFVREQTAQFKDAKDLQEITAKNMATAALAKVKDSVKKTAFSKAPEITDAVNHLHAMMLEGSRGSYDLLDATDKKVPLGNFYNKIDEMVNKLSSSPLPEDQALAGRISDVKDSMREMYGSQWQSGRTLKHLIQRLDDNSTYRPGVTAEQTGMSPYYKQMRYALDSDLKKHIPEYKQFMTGVSDDMRLLKRVSNFDTPEGAVRRLNQIHKPENMMNEWSALQDLEKRTKGDFVKDIAPLTDDQIVPEKMKPALEEANRLQKAYEDVTSHENQLKVKMAFEKEMENSGPAQVANKAKQTLDEALAEHKKFKSLNPDSASLDSKLKAAMADKAHATKLMRELPKYKDVMGNERNLDELLKDIKVREAFQKHGRLNGFRMAGSFGLPGALLGHYFGHEVVGGITGVVAAHLIENSGPAGVKKVLDFFIKHHGDELAKATGVTDETALRQLLSKVIDGSQKISAAGFKAGATYSAAAMAGDMAMDKKSKDIFNPKKDIEIKTDTKKLKKNLEQHSSNPVESLQGVGGDIHHYFPDHQGPIASTVGTAVSYLQSQKFNRTPASTFDAPKIETPGQRAMYERTLSIAEYPSNVLGYIKNGQLTPKDVTDLKSMYPSVYNKMVQKVTASMFDHANSGKSIPYATRMSLALFTGQPLDSTMTPSSIIAAQPQPTPPPQMPKGSSTKNLGKMAQNAQTPGQARQSEQSEGK